MEKFGLLMVQKSLAAMQKWDALGLTTGCVSVNFSAAELRNPDLVGHVRTALENSALDPNRLVIEVLETVVASRREDQIVETLSGLAHLGCGLDLDDFGTGHAAITSIRHFSIGRIKIDRSFVRGLDADPEQLAMVEAILTMARKLNLGTVAEGVETAGELDALRHVGCDHAQGFFIGRPMPVDEVVHWMQQRNAAKPDLVGLRNRVG